MNLKMMWQGLAVVPACLLLSIGTSAAPVWPEDGDVSPISLSGGYQLRLQAIDAYQAGDYVASLNLYKQALATLDDPKGPGAVVLWNELGAAAVANGNAADAEADCRTSAELNEKQGKPNLRELAISFRSLGVIYERRGQFKQAEESYEKAERAAAKGGLLDGPVGGAILRGQAICLLKQERYLEAEPLLDKALEILRRSDPGSLNYAKALSTYSLLQLQRGYYKEAEASARQALALLAGVRGEEANTIATLNNLGVALTDLGRNVDAEIEFRRAVDMGRKSPRVLAVALAEALNNMAAVEKLNGELAAAREHDMEALKLTEQGFDNTSSLEATILNNLGLIALMQKDLASAESYCVRAATLWAKSGGRDNSKYAAALMNLAAIERARKQYRKAYEIDSKALSINEGALGADHPTVATSLANQGVDLFCLKRFDESLAMLERAEGIQEKRLGRDSVATAFVLHNMATVLGQLKRFSDASETYERAIHAREVAIRDPYDATLGEWTREDAAMLRKAGRFGEAEMAEVRAMKIEVRNALRPAKLETTAESQTVSPRQPGNGFQEKTSDAPPL